VAPRCAIGDRTHQLALAIAGSDKPRSLAAAALTAPTARKGDQEGQGQEVAIPRGYKLRPVEAVQAWLAAAEISNGPVFRAVALGGKVSDAPLADDSAARIVKRYARRVGLDAASYAGSPHDLYKIVR
jgi:hypothetical protein